MVKLAIRDDDLNYFTKVEDILSVYKEIKSFPISFAVIPMVTDVSTKGACLDTKGNTVPRRLLDNKEMVFWLKDRLREESIDVLIHGITHEYHSVDGKRLAEMEWRDEDCLSAELSFHVNEISESLGHKISVFVAPSNKISKYGIRSVYKAGLNYSGIIPASFRRDFTLKSIHNYCKRWYCRLVDKLPYPGVMDYGTHKEINACLMQGYDYLVHMYEYCNQNRQPMVINVHYWHLRDFEKERKELIRFVNYALDRGAQPVTVSSLL
jgi:hypothetical protein